MNPVLVHGCARHRRCRNEPRYAVGDDTNFLLAQRYALSDREFDEFLKAL